MLGPKAAHSRGSTIEESRWLDSESVRAMTLAEPPSQLAGPKRNRDGGLTGSLIP